MENETKEPTYRRGALSRALEPWPAGHEVTTDPGFGVGGAPDGPRPTYVDEARYEALSAGGFLSDAEHSKAEEDGEEERPDALGGHNQTTSASFSAREDPPLVPRTDPRLRGEEGGEA